MQKETCFSFELSSYWCRFRDLPCRKPSSKECFLIYKILTSPKKRLISCVCEPKALNLRRKKERNRLVSPPETRFNEEIFHTDGRDAAGGNRCFCTRHHPRTCIVLFRSFRGNTNGWRWRLPQGQHDVRTPQVAFWNTAQGSQPAKRQRSDCEGYGPRTIREAFHHRPEPGSSHTARFHTGWPHAGGGDTGGGEERQRGNKKVTCSF